MKERKYTRFIVGALLGAALATSSLVGCTRRKPEVPMPTPESVRGAAASPEVSKEITPTPQMVAEAKPTTAPPTIPPLLTSTPTAPSPEAPAPAETAAPAAGIIVPATAPTVGPSAMLPLATPPVVPATRPTTMPPSAPAGGTHAIQRGETLYSIARRYSTTYQELMRINNIANPNRIYVGQLLTLPGAAAAPAPPAQPGGVYIVKPGDNLFRIALNHGVSLEALKNANGIFDPRVIYVGQQLVIPGGGAAPPLPAPQPGTQRTYVVQRGDTLFSIATRHGTTIQAIMLASNIANRNLIYPGQTLVIP